MEYKEMLLQKIARITDGIEEKATKQVKQWQDYSNDADKTIIVFGSGTMGEKCCNYLKTLGILVDYVCDNNEKIWGHRLSVMGNDIEIVPPIKMKDDPENTICFVATGHQHFDILGKQLNKYNCEATILKWHLDFYFETLILVLRLGEKELKDKLENFVGLFEDEISLNIISRHLDIIFNLNLEPGCNISFEDLCERPQYFLQQGKYLKNNEKMVDCGAFVGDTVSELINLVKYEDFKSYDCYELDTFNYNQLKETVKGFSDTVQKKIRLHKFGVGNEEKEISYNCNGGGSCIGENGMAKGQIVTLDSQFEQEAITFLKMDIEGSEIEALEGAKNIILRDKPLCAICIYHGMTDFFEIPLILKKYVPEYRLLLRHHTTYWDDTVCYAKLGAWE